MLDVKHSEIADKINDFLSEEFEVDKTDIQPEANMKETLDLDSLDYVDLVVVIENNFGIKIKPEEFSQIQTFLDFYNFIGSRISAS